MLISLAIIRGFKGEIRQKVMGFAGSIHVAAYDPSSDLLQRPIVLTDSLIQNLKSNPHISHVQPTAQIVAVLQYKGIIEPVVCKGADKTYQFNYLQSVLKQGALPKYSDSSERYQILLPALLANKLQCKVGDKIAAFFTGQTLKIRKFTVKGIYETGIEDIDKQVIITNLDVVRQLCNYDTNECSHVELLIDDYEQIYQCTNSINNKLPVEDAATPIQEIYPQLFDWLDLLDVNTNIIIVLMLIVAGINIISALLILILERTHMIGILKTIGANNAIIRNIFWHRGLRIIVWGLLWGNISGLGFCFLQYHFHLIPLDQSSYYLSSVPIAIHWPTVLAINILTTIFCMLILLLPARIVSSIHPAKTLKMD